MSRIAVTLFAVSTLLAQKSPTPPVTAANTVVLSPDACSSVTNGDILTLQWNPAFSSALEIADLHDFSLVFAPAGRPAGKGRIPQGGFELRALPAKATPEIPVPVADAHNGFLTFTFRANLKTIKPGKYNLLDASAHPELSSSPAHSIPQMTNSPLRYPFCLDVTDSSNARP